MLLGKSNYPGIPDSWANQGARASSRPEGEMKMGIIIPRPQMRKKERRSIEANLKRHGELTREYQEAGLSREEASTAAFEELRHNGKASKRAWPQPNLLSDCIRNLIEDENRFGCSKKQVAGVLRALAETYDD